MMGLENNIVHLAPPSNSQISFIAVKFDETYAAGKTTTSFGKCELPTGIVGPRPKLLTSPRHSKYMRREAAAPHGRTNILRSMSALFQRQVSNKLRKSHYRYLRHQTICNCLSKGRVSHKSKRVDQQGCQQDCTQVSAAGCSAQKNSPFLSSGTTGIARSLLSLLETRVSATTPRKPVVISSSVVRY